MNLNTKLFLGFLGALVIGNMVVLDIVVLSNSFQKTPTAQLSGKPSETFQVATSDTCPNSCIVKIDEVTASLKNLSSNSKSTPTPTQKGIKPSTTTATSAVSSVREYFVPLGAGSSSADDWTDVPGVQAYVDSTQYGSIKSVVFEASLYTPTGNQLAYARLYNVTDKHPVWNSDVMLEGGEVKLLVSTPIAFDSGNKLYQVQMKTQLKFQTNLSQSRIHITTN